MACRSRHDRNAALLVPWVLASAPGFAGCAEPNAAPPRCDAADGIATALETPEMGWSHAAPEVVYSSPRAEDLNGDGRPEIIISGGRESPELGEVIALDGFDGSLLWQVPARQQLYGSPVFVDVTLDGTKDVFVGGRKKEFLAVDGASGALLWQFQHDGVSAKDGWYNFYTAVVIDDVTGDGISDLLVSNGGEDGFPPFEPRPPGHLMILSSADGSVVASAVTPDSEETYMSPLVLPDPSGGSPAVLFGTGGETRGGGLWKTSLSDVLAGDISAATRLVPRGDKGVIAPPALADLDQDGNLDIVVATFGGQLAALHGVTGELLWELSFEGAESYSTPALGYFDSDDVPDVFAVFLHGAFPIYESAERVLVSGRDGAVLWRAEHGDFSMAGDVAVDLDGDGLDEVVFSSIDTRADPAAQQGLHVLHPSSGSATSLGLELGPAGALAASPLAGDADQDGCLDVIVARHSLGEPRAALITLLRFAATVPEEIRWSGYLGTRFDSRLPDAPR
jgi:outer membrane protein assembly factor BamB